MNQTSFYFAQLKRAILYVDVDVPDNTSYDEVRDAVHTFAHAETFYEFGDTMEVNLTLSQEKEIRQLIRKAYKV